ncbi:unnamed protein product [Bursaphelenchus okinawaensis]|uniref:Uncharacterized protein n=1 Tax=Bursaphelenchus okinawaensis TaxID=465554 RepID=A0A811KH12_9BILA|nr:unnamed protein product [Bursaphelenchus okinawaensis]CAG9102979.1 unnamed protein product [Bursaphelenchus okinawaensis]
MFKESIVTFWLANLITVYGFVLPYRQITRPFDDNSKIVDYDPMPSDSISYQKMLQYPFIPPMPVKRSSKVEKARERTNVEGHMIKQPLLKFDMVWRRFSGHKRFSNL